MNREKALAVLELQNSATPREIRSGYLDLVKVWHPDRFVNDPALQTKAHEKLKEVIEAYETLTSLSEDLTPSPQSPSSPEPRSPVDQPRPSKQSGGDARSDFSRAKASPAFKANNEPLDGPPMIRKIIMASLVLLILLVLVMLDCGQAA